MARTTIEAVALTDTGYNLTDSTGFATLGTGASNGVSFTFDSNTLIVLKNDTGGSAVFTVKVPTPTSYSGMGITFADVTVTVATGKLWLLEPNGIFRQTDGNVYIDCNVAGKVMVLA